MSDLEKIKFMAAQAAVTVVNQVIEHPVMKTMKPELQEPIMQQFIEENPSIQFAYVVDMNGRKTTKNITNIADRAKYENYGVGTDQSDREWFIKPLQSREDPRHQLLHLQDDRGALHHRLFADRRREGRDGRDLRRGHQV